MKKHIQFGILLFVFGLTTACTKSTKDMVDAQQNLVNNTPFPSGEEPEPTSQTSAATATQAQAPSPQAASAQAAIQCELSVFPELVTVYPNGTANPTGMQLGQVGRCIGPLASGDHRDEVNELVDFEKTNLKAKVKFKDSVYTAQFFLPGPNGDIIVDSAQLNLKSKNILTRLLKLRKETFLIRCQARSVCDQ